ncbi:MAG: HupE/UreJ family protein [Bauldia sp.]
MRRHPSLYAASLAIAAISTVPAFAYLDLAAPVADGLGLSFSGPGNVAAVAAVGAWTALRGRHHIWAWSVALAGFIALGAGLALVGVPLLAQPPLLVAVAALAAMTAAAIDTPGALPAIAAAALATAYGHLEGISLLGTPDAPFCLAGFLAATAVLQAAGAFFTLALTGRLRRSAHGDAAA